MAKRNYLKIISKLFLESNYRCQVFAVLGLYNRLSDEEFLKRIFEAKTGKPLNIQDPRSFNEKLQWLKLHDRDPMFTQMVDKYEVKAIVEDIIGKQYVIPTLGVWDSFEDVDFDILPEQFVLKCTHDCGGLLICRDKSKLNLADAERRIKKSLKRRYFYISREWPYKNVQPRIMAEEYIQDGERQALPVYKFFCFGGEPKIIQTIQNDKQHDETIDYFDTEWNRLDLRQNFPNSKSPLEKPARLKDMLLIARKLAQVKKDFIRVDLYCANDNIYFSEYTFYSDAGVEPFHPEQWDQRLGDWIELPTA